MRRNHFATAGLVGVLAFGGCRTTDKYEKSPCCQECLQEEKPYVNERFKKWAQEQLNEYGRMPFTAEGLRKRRERMEREEREREERGEQLK